MNIEKIQSQKRQIVEKFGEWTAHNIRLEGDLYTIAPKIVGDEIRLRRVLQVVSDIAGKPLNTLRILDLACLEGLFAIEFARHGAEVVGIEGREANVEKARFSKRVLSLDNLEFVQDDVRHLSRERYGVFDVVLCLGILYHLDAADILPFLESISHVCRGFALIDTHVSLKPEKSYEFGGKIYWGRTFFEHDARSAPEEKEKARWASLDNPRSFWLTRPSLYNLLSHVGFTSAHECYIPEESNKPPDRITVLAVKGDRRELMCCPLMNAESAKDIPEESSARYRKKPFGGLSKVGRFIPGPVKEFIKKRFYS
jgi:2-polyprenyl-3-methyl-5-hydroxy-6-metoxy-1,4-benzoquinol methylase